MKLTIPDLSLVVLIGPSGSGKSTFAHKHFKPTEILSSDFCRGLVSDSESDQSANDDAFDVLHYIAKVGYQVYQSEDEKLRIYVNLGAGAMTFEPDVDGADSFNYGAINAGAKLYYMFNPNVGIVVSPQGDIAFTSEDDGFTGSTGWVWPFTAGIAVGF